MPLLMNHVYTGAVRINTGSEMDYIVRYNSCSMTFFSYVKGIFLTGKVTVIWLTAQVSLLKLFETSTHFLILQRNNEVQHVC